MILNKICSDAHGGTRILHVEQAGTTGPQQLNHDQLISSPPSPGKGLHMHIGYSLFHWFILPWKSLYADKIVLPSKSGLLPNAGERFTPSSSATQLTADPLGTAEPLRTRLNGMESNLYIYRGGLGALILTTGGAFLI